MKRLLIFPAVLLLSACSTNSELNVVDNLTLVASNDGLGMNPARWVISGHPLQTTYVSLNGQLGLKTGQVCVASRFRSPFTNNCRAINIESGLFYREQYKKETSGEAPLKSFLNSVYELRESQIDYVSKSKIYYSCVSNKKVEISQDKKLDDRDAVSEIKNQLPEICTNERNKWKEASRALNSKQLAARKQAIVPNRVVYNWAETLDFQGGAVVQKSTNNAASGSLDRAASGYTVANGILLERYQLKCEEIKNLQKKYGDSERLKVVTMTLSADELYYDARKDKVAAFNANLTFSPRELKTLDRIFDSDIEMTINAALASSSSLASSGYLVSKESSNTSENSSGASGTSTNNGLTYYAVLTDLTSFQC